MTHAENKLRWCLKKAEKEIYKHRGLRNITPSMQKAEDHIKKAEHNLTVMEHMIQKGFNDWAVNASFYVHYHCLLAILQKFGYESRNQECTFAAIEYLIEQGKINLTKTDLYKIFATDQQEKLEETGILNLREKLQYGTETLYEERKVQELLEQTKVFIEETKSILQR